MPTNSIAAKDQPRSILLPRFDTFGDIILFAGFITELRQLFPATEIYLLVRSSYLEISHLFPNTLNLKWLHVDEPAYIEPTKKQKQKFFEFLRQLKNYSFDLIIAGALNRTWLDNSLLSHFEATRQIVFGAPNVKPLSFSACRDVVVVDEFCHETFKYQVLLKHLDSDREIHPPKLNIRPTDALAGSTILADLGLGEKPFAVCMPAGTFNQKNKVWPLANYALVIEEIFKKWQVPTVVTAHDNETIAVTTLCTLVAQRGIPVYHWLGRDGELGILAALVARSAIYFGNDSGPMHLASALGVPVVAVFGGGTYPRFLPTGTRSISVTAELPCFGCYWNCLFGTAPCMRFVPATEVMQAVNAVLSGSHIGNEVLNTAPSILPDVIEIIKCACNERTNAEFASKEVRKLKEIVKERGPATFRFKQKLSDFSKDSKQIIARWVSKWLR